MQKYIKFSFLKIFSVKKITIDFHGITAIFAISNFNPEPNIFQTK